MELRLFIYLIGQARYSEEPYKQYERYDITINRGEYLRSYRNLADDLKYYHNNQIKKPSVTKIKRTVDKLEDQGRIETRKTRLGTVFRIVNYMEYQDLKAQNGTACNRVETGLKQACNNTVIKGNKGRANNNGDSDQDEKKSDPPKKYKKLFEYYCSKKHLINHRSFNPDYREAIQKAEKRYDFDFEDCKKIIDRHNELVKIAENSNIEALDNFKIRELDTLFGQGKYKGKGLICKDYKDDGDYYRRYLKNSTNNKSNILTGAELTRLRNKAEKTGHELIEGRDYMVKNGKYKLSKEGQEIKNKIEGEI